MFVQRKKSAFLTIFLVGITCVLIGGLFGTVTNMINGLISPDYFKKVMNWNFENIWTAIVAEGLLEGLLYGILFSLIFTIGFGVITKGKARFIFGLRQLLKTTAFVCICWLIGGLFAILLTNINPDFYRNLFPFTPRERMEMIRFAWVGGSTWGGMIGGLLSAILGVMLLRNSWYEIMNPEEN